MLLNEHNMKDIRGDIVNVQHFCVHDGEGIRTVIFFKGCPLHCIWCSNPEAQKKEKEIACYRNLCQGCMRCMTLCKEHALMLKGKYISGIQATKCTHCGACAAGCYAQALKIYGKSVTKEALVNEILADKVFYDASGGGVTLSGGEVLNQPAFAIAVLQACKEAGIHTCVETSAYGAWEDLKAIVQWCDELYIDLKHMDASLHKLYTGVSNEVILSNISHLSRMKKAFVIRIPIIPGINDDENLLDTFIYVHKLKYCSRIGLLPYHTYGVSKYEALGRRYTLNSIKAPDDSFLQYYKRLCIEHFHKPCEIGW